MNSPHLPRSRRALVRTVTSVGRFGFGRQGALAASGRLLTVHARTPAQQAASLFIGSMMVGTAVALLKQADLGLSPYDVLVSGLQPRLELSFGQTVWVISGVLFLVAALLGQRPSRWGIAYTVANGFSVDAVSGLVNAPDAMFGRVLFVVTAIVVLSLGIALVVHSGSTGGSFELLMRAGEVRGFERRVVRTSLEVGVLTAGILLGGRFGPATIAVALAIGPCLVLSLQLLEDHDRGRELRQIATSPVSRHPSSAAAGRG